MDTAVKGPLSSIQEDEISDVFVSDAPVPKKSAKKNTNKRGPSASLSRQSLASRGKSRMRLPADRAGKTEENLEDLNLVLKRTESLSQHDGSRPSTSEKSRLPPIGHRAFLGGQNELEILGVHDPSQVTHRVKPAQARIGPNLIFDPEKSTFVVTVDPESAALVKDIAALLQIHSLGIPIEITFYPNKHKKGRTPGIQGVFHCRGCLAYWQRTGKARQSCDEPTELIRSPVIQMNASDAAKLLSTLTSSNKFLSNTELEKVLPLLRQAKDDAERNRILGKLAENTESKKGTGGKNRQKQVNQTPSSYMEQQNKRSKQLTTKVCQAMRDRIFNTVTTELTDELTDSKAGVNSRRSSNSATIKSVGLKDKDGSFYPGFFSKVEEETRNETEDMDKGTPFVTQGRIDDDGCYRQMNDRDMKAQNLPTLQQVTQQQEDDSIRNARNSSNIRQSDGLVSDASNEMANGASNVLASNGMENDTADGVVIDRSNGLENDASNRMANNTTDGVVNTTSDEKGRYKLAFQDGPELKLKDAMSSGMWHTKENDEYLLPGVFNSGGQFMASGAITTDGHAVPGSSDSKGRFVPFANYDENGDIVEQDPDPNMTPGMLDVARKLRRSPACPNAGGVDEKEWKCVRDGVIVDDPRQITVYTEPDTPAYESDEDYSVFAGGEIGPDGNLYPYGSYNESGEFIPGSEPISVGGVKRMSEGTNNANSTGFLNDLGIQMKQKEEDGGREKAAALGSKEENTREDFIPTAEMIEATKSDMDHEKTGLQHDGQHSGVHESRSTGSVGKGSRKSKRSEKSGSRQLHTSSSRSISSRDSSRIFNRKSGEISRTPSVVFIQEKSVEELNKSSPSRRPSSPRKTKEPINPLVKNRTGKPNTRAGSLAENLMNTAQGESDASQMIAGSQTAVFREAATRQQNPDSTRSKEALGTRTSSYGKNSLSDRNRTSRMSVDRTRSVEDRGQIDGVSRRMSQLSTSGDRKNVITPDKRRSSQLNVDGPKMNTPATVARQREIEKKTRREKAEVKAKYQNAAHHSALGGGTADQDQLTLGGTKTTSRSALNTAQASRTQLPDGQTSTTSRLSRMRPTSSNQSNITGRKTSKGQMRQRHSSKFLRDLPTIDPLADDADESKEPMNEKKSEENFLVFSDDDDDEFNFSDMSSLSGEEDDFEDPKKKSFYFPFLNGFSILNFTENFRFSYFAVPGYVKDHNQQVRKGVLKLPVIQEKKKNKGEKKEKKKNNLLKRIEKLNQMGSV